MKVGGWADRLLAIDFLLKTFAITGGGRQAAFNENDDCKFVRVLFQVFFFGCALESRKEGFGKPNQGRLFNSTFNSSLS